MTKFYICEKKNWVCVKQKKNDMSFAKTNKCIYKGHAYVIEDIVYDMDTDVIEVLLK